MAGRFLKAPLVYVTARIRTTKLPKLSSDQEAALEQAMVKVGLPELKSGTVKQLNLGDLAGLTESVTQIDASKLYKQVSRRAFMRKDHRESLVMEQDGFEFRLSEYSKYGNFISRYQEVLAALTDAVDAFAGVVAQEFILSYADVIVPYSGRRLKDYFKNDGKILPLNVLDESNQDEKQVGQVQINRIASPNERILIFLEQLPVADGNRISRFLPQSMTEPETEFGMPLKPNLPTEITSKDYGLMMTEAAKIEEVGMSELDFEKTFGGLHHLTKDTFWSLINDVVCKEDWLFEE